MHPVKPYTLPAPEAPARTAQERQHAAAIRFGWRMKAKLTDNQKLAAAIAEHCTLYDVHLPPTRKGFNGERAEVLRLKEYGDQLADLLEPAIKLHYALRTTWATYASFGEGPAARLVPMTFFYSRHRLDYAWNLRKSQIIRQRYATYLATATDAKGRLLTGHYHPVHLTLTAPHSGGTFRGQSFYARELMQAFAELRKTDIWKSIVYAGEYGVEVKRGKGGQHGLHIHTHSFILQNPEWTVNGARAALAAVWQDIVGNTSGYSGLDYRTLYCKKKNAQGVTERVDLVAGVSPLADYTSGVMECIKYHFKPDCLTKVGGGYDMPLILDVLANTHNLRMYSRFGAFYKEPALNFNSVHDPTPADELSAEGQEELITASSDGVEERLVDPRTMQVAASNSYVMKVGNPLALRYFGETSHHPREAYELANSMPLLTVPSGLTLKEVITFKMKGCLEHVCYLPPDGLVIFREKCAAEAAVQASLWARAKADKATAKADKAADEAYAKAEKVVTRAEKAAGRAETRARTKAEKAAGK